MVRHVTLVAALAAVIAGMLAVPGLAHNGVRHVPPIDRMPVAQPEVGLVYKGLRIATTGPCVGAYKLGASNRCTHGPDAAPEGVDVKVDAAAIRFLPFAPLPKVQCDGDGVSGKRVQVIYDAHPTSRTGTPPISTRSASGRPRRTRSIATAPPRPAASGTSASSTTRAACSPSRTSS